MRYPFQILFLAATAAMLFSRGESPRSAAADPVAGQASWKPPEWGDVRGQVLAWLDDRQVDSQLRERVLRFWPEAEPAEPFDRLGHLLETLALVDDDVRGLIEALPATLPAALPDADWLDDNRRPNLVRANCRLHFGRWAVRNELYDEAHEQIDGLKVDDVVDPASLLFYQAVVRQRLLLRNEGLEAINRLLENEKHSPRRYTALARLMRSDLEDLEDESLDHIARRMDDVRRRLYLGRADRQVRMIEDGVIESLDQLIEKLQQQQQQQGAQSGSPQGGPASRPASDSLILPGRGPGEVTKKDVGSGSGWGDLPPRQREAALQQIGREFPSHYRDAVEQYFRRLAGPETDR